MSVRLRRVSKYLDKRSPQVPNFTYFDENSKFKVTIRIPNLHEDSGRCKYDEIFFPKV